MQIYRATPLVGIFPKPNVVNAFKLKAVALATLIIKPKSIVKKGKK
jgi:hypothetical protein